MKLGRQRIVYDNAAFIGNVGWRQNEQTCDAISLTNTSVPGLTVNYAYIDEVHRIFGEDATGIFENAPSEIHLLNASYAGIKGVTLGGYIYLMDFEDAGSNGWDNDTFGISAKGALGGTHGGLTDTYVSHMLPIFWGMKWTNSTHLFGDNAINTGFGFDSVLAKKFDDHFTAIAKLGYFDTSDALYKSTTRVSVELNYTF